MRSTPEVIAAREGHRWPRVDKHDDPDGASAGAMVARSRWSSRSTPRTSAIRARWRRFTQLMKQAAELVGGRRRGSHARAADQLGMAEMVDVPAGVLGRPRRARPSRRGRCRARRRIRWPSSCSTERPCTSIAHVRGRWSESIDGVRARRASGWLARGSDRGLRAVHRSTMAIDRCSTVTRPAIVDRALVGAAAMRSATDVVARQSHDGARHHARRGRSRRSARRTTRP